MTAQEMETTVKALTAPGKGVLVADESTGTIEKRFKGVNAPCTEETRREYRDMSLILNGGESCITTVGVSGVCISFGGCSGLR